MLELGFLRSAEAHAKKMASAMASAVSGVTGIAVSSAVSSVAARVWAALVGFETVEGVLHARKLLGFLRRALSVHTGGATAVEALESERARLPLYRLSFAYKTTHHVREDVAEAANRKSGADEDKECTFAPKINERSSSLEEARQAAVERARAAAITAAEADPANFHEAAAELAAAAAFAHSAGGGKLPRSGVPRYLALYDHARTMESRITRDRLDKEAKEQAELSFKPKLVTNPSTYSTASDSARPMGAKRFEHLNSLASKPRKIPTRVPSYEEQQLAECTFKPTVFTHGRRASLPAQPAARPAGYEQAVERLRKVQEDKKAREMEEEEAALRRAAQAAMPARPFAFATEERQAEREARPAPLLFMDVNLGPGRTGRIGLHEGDDPRELAANFAKAYGLDASVEAKLAGLIERHLQEVVADLYHEVA
ncbi:hypothetical protein Ctob_007819 [Chrysochromulina tobinii]|uniref:Uncharacterized protein n=1 Tax=Chrysochromulina tobinii TaxID=1460289 RepID=A0A0M0JZT4_9EUKA|nr:hypothetical protein Ctob_007819 [Chrysochromulina tobinii]|eukprot:KOO32060.1 hypothetical protein Ctob_007819 [Chrysochromulina sp. CCMP291]